MDNELVPVIIPLRSNKSFRADFPVELSTKILSFLVESLPSLQKPHYDAVREIDIGYFEKRTVPHSYLFNALMVNKHFAGVAQPILLKYVRLARMADIDSFHRLTLPGAIMDSTLVKEIQIFFDQDAEKGFDIAATVEKCAAIMKHLPNITKIDISNLGTHTIFDIYEAPGGIPAYDRLWSSIPKTVETVMVPNATFVPLLYSYRYEDRLQLLDRFVEDHPHLNTWSFVRWTVDKTELKKCRPQLAGFPAIDVPEPLNFAGQHLFRLLKYCKTLEINSDYRKNDLDFPTQCRQWSYPDITHVSSNFVFLWPEEFRCTTIRTVQCQWITSIQLSRLLKQLTNLSTFVYSLTTLDGITWKKGISSTSLKHVMLFTETWRFPGLSSKTVASQLLPPPPSMTEQEIKEQTVMFREAIREVRSEFEALEDRQQFPALESISIYFDPFVIILEWEMKMSIVEAALQDALRCYEKQGIKITIGWGTYSQQNF